MTATTYTVLGTTDEQDTCDCCGKRRLKMVVALRTDEGDVVKFGRSCAAPGDRVGTRQPRPEGRRGPTPS